jgi:hypothetical protein
MIGHRFGYDPRSDSSLYLWADPTRTESIWGRVGNAPGGALVNTAVDGNYLWQINNLYGVPNNFGYTGAGTGIPTWVRNGINGRPAAHYAAGSCNPLTSDVSTGLGSLSGLTAVVVASYSAVTEEAAILQVLKTAPSYRVWFGALGPAPSNGFEVYGRRLDGDSYSNPTGGTVVLNTPAIYVYSVDFVNAKFSLWVNNVAVINAVTFGTPGVTDATEETAVCLWGKFNTSAKNTQGYIGDTMLFKRAYSSGDADTVFKGLRYKWGL